MTGFCPLLASCNKNQQKIVFILDDVSANTVGFKQLGKTAAMLSCILGRHGVRARIDAYIFDEHLVVSCV